MAPTETAAASTVERTILSNYVPPRLDDLDLTVYDQLTDFHHRGHHCNVDRLISFLGAALDNTAVMRGDTAEPCTLSEFDAVEIITDNLTSRFGAWFGQEADLEDLDGPVSDQHLSASRLENAYFGEQINPDTQPIPGDDWDAQKRVIIPLVGILLTELQDQMAADDQIATDAAQQTIKRTIMTEVYANDLSEDELETAIAEAKQALRRT